MKQTTPSARKNARILLQTKKKKSVPNFIIGHVISAGYQITHYFLLLLELALCDFFPFSFSFPFFSFFFPFSTAKVPVRGHFRQPTSQTEYVRLNTPNTFRFHNLPYIPPFC